MPAQQTWAFEKWNYDNPSSINNRSKNQGRNRANTHCEEVYDRPSWTQTDNIGGKPRNRDQNRNVGGFGQKDHNSPDPCWPKFPCTLCGSFDHFTHHYLEIQEFKHIRKGKHQGNLPNVQEITSANHSPPVVLQNHFQNPLQWLVQQQDLTPYGLINNHCSQNIFMNATGMNLQTRNNIYPTP